LVDQHERDLIQTALDRSMLVEAAAGTGKTTELVKRIVNVLGEGKARVEQIVAVTFTDKAAGEMKLRLRSELEEARKAGLVAGTFRSAALEEEAGRASPNGGEERVRQNLGDALARLEEAHVSTIHGFCAELLRERPVEARVDPQFEAIGDAQAERVYGEAFTLWLQAKLEDPPEGVGRSLRRKSQEGPVERLRSAGWVLADWRDFRRLWRRPPLAREAAIDALVQRLQAFDALTSHPSNSRDYFYLDTRKARRIAYEIRVIEKVRARDYDGLEASLVDLATDRDFQRAKGYGKEYGEGVTRAEVLDAHQELVQALRGFATDADADLAALLQAELIDTVLRYEELKFRSGRLDFLDLLLLARNLIRDCDGVRAEFQRRFTHIFIDEFQDTDPLQAEILLLLASDDPAVRDWRQVTPVPGKLFIVGDPKQSIYRFRRADVGIYQEVKKQLSKRGALLVNLTTSFRAVPSIQNMVNAAFAPVMTGDTTTLQAHYVPLSPYRQEVADQPTVVALPVPEPYGKRALAASAIEESLPDAVGAFVAWLLNDSQWMVTERDPASPDERRPISARHICLLFRRFDSWGTDVTRPYVEALEARDISHLMVGGKSFHVREEVQTMRAALCAIEWPDDELSVFAALKGSLFAIGDAELLEYRHRYRRLHPYRISHPRPDDISGEPVPEHLQPIVESLQLLQSLHRDRNYRPVAETIVRLLEATRAHAAFALRPWGEQVLANVLHVAEMARAYEESGGISFRGFVERLREEAESGEAPEAPILEEGSDGVRIMTVHKAKGLEFPVVILADVTAKLTRSHASRYIAPEQELCAVQIAGWSPVDLLEHDKEELARDKAEGVRIAYVAATRARDLLVIPAVGDDPFELGWEAVNAWWVSPLNPAIYPDRTQRRHPAKATNCPVFGQESVLSRPSGDWAVTGNVCPGLHNFESGPAPTESGVPGPESRVSGTARLDSYGVVWWDPSKLKLGAEMQFGIRQKELLQEVDREVVEADRKVYADWRASRDEAVARGSQPSLVVKTATEWAAGTAVSPPRPAGVSPTQGFPVTTIDVDRDLERPAGPRYGALVHAVLATIPLDASSNQIHEVATLQGRILGATAQEVGSAAKVVVAVLDHPLMARAREAAKHGRCRRESPVTLSVEGTLVEGVVDVAFLEEDRWTVLDFKTDRELEKRLEDYRRQVGIYADAIASATGQKAEAILMRV
jgi:ATP-dependent exoDNAse (exonuclease V) beta subunit